MYESTWNLAQKKLEKTWNLEPQTLSKPGIWYLEKKWEPCYCINQDWGTL